ncbi:MAG TPA: DNA primase, partial [Bacillus sp. (in: Bacteria)]|nr:DNA primase [Bacillus sp. (in: firmicutes)]
KFIRRNISDNISTDEFINPEYTEEVLQGHLETLRRHQEKLEKMEIIFKVKQMEKTDPVEAAKYYVAYLQNQKARK